MNTFTVHLFAADRYERVDGVASFVGEDKSGSFGLQARHDRFMTVLTFGLARLLLADGSREYLGFPGGLLYFIDNELRISTRRYLRDTDVARITQGLTSAACSPTSRRRRRIFCIFFRSRKAVRRNPGSCC